jgi:hypothetical protein
MAISNDERLSRKLTTYYNDEMLWNNDISIYTYDVSREAVYFT